MFVELLTENKRKPKLKKKIIVESNDPTEILRDNGFKIKKAIPKRNYIEIVFFENAEEYNFRCLKDFKYLVKDGKLYVYYEV